MKLLDYESGFSQFQDQCNEAEGTPLEPKVLYSSAPQSFGGVTPESAYWPRVEAAYSAYRAFVCDAASPRNLLVVVGADLAQQLSQEDLLAAIDFYASATGRRLQQANSAANGRLRARIEQALRLAYP